MQVGRRFIGAAAVLAVVLVVVGFGVAALDPSLSVGGSTGPTGSVGRSAVASSASTQPRTTVTPVPSASPTHSRTPSPSASLRPSPSPSPSPSKRPAGFVVEDNSVFYVAADGSSYPVPDLPGLQIQIQSGRASYYAVAGNKYGLKVGSYAGEFMPLVTMGQPDGSSAETGGLVLAGPVVSHLIGDALASIDGLADKWIVALPVDIRSARSAGVDVTFDAFGLGAIENTPRVVVSFSGTLPLVESIPTNAGVHVLVEGLNVTAWQVIDPARLSLPADAIDPAHAMNQLLIYGDGKTSLDHDLLVDDRLVVGAQIMEVSSSVSVSLVVEGSHADLGPGNVLQVAGVPVFVASAS